MNFGGIVYTLALLAGLMGVILVIVGGVSALLDGGSAGTWALVVSGMGALLFLELVRLAYRHPKEMPMTRRDGIFTVVISWFGLSGLAALPFYLSEAILSYLDSFFEAVSGLTTTGATILVDVEVLPLGLHLWRSTTQWLGGMGIIVLFVAVLPALGVGGYNLYRAEVSGPSKERLRPTARETAILLWSIYSVFTVAGIIALRAAGMPWFDSVCHTFGGLATGGFGTKNASIGGYSPLIQTIVVILMFVGGVNFGLWAKLWLGVCRGNRQLIKEVFADEELRTYVVMLIAGAAVMFAVLHTAASHTPVRKDVLASVFQTVSIMTTTGYVSEDYDKWPGFCRMLIVMLMFIGGCAGSTSGGIKVIRLLLAGRLLRKQVHSAIQTRMVESVHFNGRAVPEEVLTGAIAYIMFYVGTFAVGTLLVALSLDVWPYPGDASYKFETAFSAVAATLSSTGPGLSGVWANCADIPVMGKAVLIASMLLGRLEIVGLLALLSFRTWRR
jgi:trk system potassium uptake protein TrkH